MEFTEEGLNIINSGFKISNSYYEEVVITGFAEGVIYYIKDEEGKYQLNTEDFDSNKTYYIYHNQDLLKYDGDSHVLQIHGNGTFSGKI
jgi:hypothetical protein